MADIAVLEVGVVWVDFRQGHIGKELFEGIKHFVATDLVWHILFREELQQLKNGEDFVVAGKGEQDFGEIDACGSELFINFGYFFGWAVDRVLQPYYLVG